MSLLVSQLLEILESLGESVQFCSSGCLPGTLPGLEIEGIGTIGVPISAADDEDAVFLRAPIG